MQTLKERLQKLHLDKDPYELLESSPADEFSQVKKKYRALALKFHPDRNKEEQATQRFIQISRAYEFLEKEENRDLYAQHIKAMAEEKQRIEAMDQERRILIENLKRRQEEKVQRKEEFAAQLKRRKQFFQKMEREEEQRDKLRREIQSEMNPKEFIEKLSSIEMYWEKGLSFTSSMLSAFFSDYCEVVRASTEPKRRQATVVLSSIEKASQIVQQFSHPMVRIQLMVKGNDRARLLGAMQKRRSGGDFSLSTENIERLKQMLNRDSNLYFKGYNV